MPKCPRHKVELIVVNPSDGGTPLQNGDKVPFYYECKKCQEHSHGIIQEFRDNFTRDERIANLSHQWFIDSKGNYYVFYAVWNLYNKNKHMPKCKSFVFR